MWEKAMKQLQQKQFCKANRFLPSHAGFDLFGVETGSKCGSGLFSFELGTPVFSVGVVLI